MKITIMKAFKTYRDISTLPESIFADFIDPGFQKLGISNVNIIKLDYSKMEQF